jgi:hypothetical protein
MDLNGRRSLAAAFTVAAVSVTALMASQQAVAQKATPPGAPVNVVSPLPLPVTVQGSVSGTVSGTVSAVQSGSWNVGVNGTVTTKNTDEPGRNPFSALHDPFNANPSCFGEGGGFQGCTFSGFPTVPAGMRLVITDFSGQVRAPAGCKVASISLGTDNEGGGDLPWIFRAVYSWKTAPGG